MRRSRNVGGTSDDELIRRFAGTFELLDGRDTNVDWPCGRPAAIVTKRVHLEPLYRRLPRRFPDLYERLVLTYRWPVMDLQIVQLLSNPRGPTLSGLADEIFRDPVLTNTLIPTGFVPFGKATDTNYDPVCFDLNSMTRGDCPVIQFEHEAILRHDKIGESYRRSSSFRELIYDTIELAQSMTI
jgi:hypothetical protein